MWPFHCLSFFDLCFRLPLWYCQRRVWRYQRGNQNPYIEEEKTTQWPEEKVQKDKQRSTKHTHKTKDRVRRTPLKTGGQLRSGRVSSFCSTNDTRRVNLVTNPSNQNYVSRQNKNQIISFFCNLYKNAWLKIAGWN